MSVPVPSGARQAFWGRKGEPGRGQVHNRSRERGFNSRRLHFRQSGKSEAWQPWGISDSKRKPAILEASTETDRMT